MSRRSTAAKRSKISAHAPGRPPQEARGKAKGIIINAGAYTHTSVAILDALQAAELPVIEVHLSNIFRRDQFRQHSYVSLAATGVICGLGGKGYELAIEAMANILATRKA